MSDLVILARGPWRTDAVVTTWREDPYVYDPATRAEADRALAALAERGSPSHEGVSARLAACCADDDGLTLELERVPWSARLLPDKHGSCALVCVVRDADGRWLAGRRAPWLAIWPGEWMLGGAGGVEPGEDPVEGMVREVVEEWSVQPRDVTVEAVVRLPDGIVWLVGQAWLAPGASVQADEEHDGVAWWPASPAEWPTHVRDELRALGGLLSG